MTIFIVSVFSKNTVKTWLIGQQSLLIFLLLLYSFVLFCFSPLILLSIGSQPKANISENFIFCCLLYSFPGLPQPCSLFYHLSNRNSELNLLAIFTPSSQALCIQKSTKIFLSQMCSIFIPTT